MKERKLGLLGRKVGMTTVFDDSGRSLGVTVVELGPCLVMGHRSVAQHGYSALVLGFGARAGKSVRLPEAGNLEPLGGLSAARRHVQEVCVSEATRERFAPGAEVTVGDLEVKVGDWVDVQGTSIGKGFQGVVRKYGFAGMPATHGTHEFFRHTGSIGCRKWPGRVFKGRRMPGHMGHRTVTTQNLTVVQVRPEDNAIVLHGSIPGAAQGQLLLRPAIKRNPLA